MTTTDGPMRSLSLTSLAIEDAVRVLAAAGWRDVTIDVLRQDIAAGLPTNGDGTLNLVTYTAWLVKELEHGGHS